VIGDRDRARAGVEFVDRIVTEFRELSENRWRELCGDGYLRHTGGDSRLRYSSSARPACLDGAILQ
jgi:hypothetical protein